MLNFAKYRYNPATVDACRVTEDNLVELSAIVATSKIKVKPKVGEWVIKKESGMYEIWQNKAFEKKFTEYGKLTPREAHPSNGSNNIRSAGEAVLEMASQAFGSKATSENANA